MIYPDLLPKPIESLFLDIIGDRLHAENFEFSMIDGGYLFTEKGEQEHADQIDETQPMVDFACITVASPMQEYCFVCARDTPIFHALCCMLGVSIPQKLEWEPVDIPGSRLSLTPDIVVGASDLKVLTGVPSKLLLHEKAFREHRPDVQVVCVLMPEHCIVLPRKDCENIGAVSLMLFHFGDFKDSNIIFRDLGGNLLGLDDQCPDAIFAFEKVGSPVTSMITQIGIRFERHHLTYRAIATAEEIVNFLHMIKANGVLDYIRAIGWDFLPKLSY